MFAFDTLNNEVKINLNPIYQSINGLSEDKLDKTEYDVLFDGLFLDSQKKLSNYLDRSREAYFMDAYEWTKQTYAPTPLNSGYYAAKSELNTVLNYNNNVNYVENFADIISFALRSTNIYQNRIELTGNLNFSKSLLLTNTDIKTIVLKNKNVNNTFAGVFSKLTYSKNSLYIDIEGFDKITNLQITNNGGEFKIKNCNEIINSISFSNNNDVGFKNIGILNLSEKTNSGKFIKINNLKFKNMIINVNENLGFQSITNLDIQNATISGFVNSVNMFSSIENANFDRVSFNLKYPSSLPISNYDLFHNNSANIMYARSLNNFMFKNCCFTDLDTNTFFGGLNGTCKGCVFNRMNFRNANSLNIIVNYMYPYSPSSITFSFYREYNTINIINSYSYVSIISANSKDNIINVKNENMAVNINLSISINEGPFDKSYTLSKNIYNFENNNDRLTMNIYYGNSTSAIQGRNPEIHLGKNHNVLNFKSANNLHCNVFDIYFNDVFNETNLNVDEFKNELATATDSWNTQKFNLFNLHFDKDSVFDSAFYNRFLILFGGDMSTNDSFKNSFFTDWVKFYGRDEKQITNFV